MKAVFRSLGLSRAILPLWIHLQGTLMNSIEKSFGAADTRKFLRLLHRFREPRLKWHLVIPPVNFPIPHNEQYLLSLAARPCSPVISCAVSYTRLLQMSSNKDHI